MQLQYIPSSSAEIITSTLAGAKSIRGYFFVLKDENWLKSIQFQPVVSISVDGKDLCKDLMIMPFCSNQLSFHDVSASLGFKTQDFRKVNISTCMNVSESVVRVSATADNAMDLVLILSDEPVDYDNIQWIESVKMDSTKVDSSNYMNAFFREKPEAIFAYEKFTAAGQATLFGEGGGRSLEINGNKDICPLLLEDIAPTTRSTWKDVLFRIEHPSMDKNIRLSAGSLSTDPIFLYFIKNIKK